jgi:hypothetical protein
VLHHILVKGQKWTRCNESETRGLRGLQERAEDQVDLAGGALYIKQINTAGVSSGVVADRVGRGQGETRKVKQRTRFEKTTHPYRVRAVHRVLLLVLAECGADAVAGEHGTEVEDGSKAETSRERKS